MQYHGYYCKEKWETKKDRELSAPKFPMQTQKKKRFQIPLTATIQSQPLTTFITEWYRFMYFRMPQGYLASGDAYTRRYDEIIKNVDCKIKIVDILLLDKNIEDTFYDTLDYLLLCKKNGIVLNRKIPVLPRRSPIRGPPNNIFRNDPL